MTVSWKHFDFHTVEDLAPLAPLLVRGDPRERVGEAQHLEVDDALAQKVVVRVARVDVGDRER